MPTALQNKRANVLLDKAAKDLSAREPRWVATRRALATALTQLVIARGVVRAETNSGWTVFETLVKFGLASNGPRPGTFVATSVGYGYVPTEEERGLAFDAMDAQGTHGHAAGKTRAPKGTPTDLNLYTLHKEIERQGPVLRQFPATSIAGIRRLVDAGYLAPALHEKNAWELTGQGLMAYEGWKERNRGRYGIPTDYVIARAAGRTARTTVRKPTAAHLHADAVDFAIIKHDAKDIVRHVKRLVRRDAEMEGRAAGRGRRAPDRACDLPSLCACKVPDPTGPMRTGSCRKCGKPFRVNPFEAQTKDCACAAHGKTRHGRSAGNEVVVGFYKDSSGHRWRITQSQGDRRRLSASTLDGPANTTAIHGTSLAKVERQIEKYLAKGGGRSAGVRRTIPGGCTIVAVGENGDADAIDALGLDFWEAADKAEALFKVDIRPSSDEEIVLAAICDKKVVGGATLGVRSSDDEAELTFSIAIDPAWQKRNLGRALVEQIERLARDATESGHGTFRVWVVNPNMAKLLDSMGYDAEGRNGEWSEDSPHMTKSF